ncbi:5' nucleotidase, NT5C type [Microbulbifer sp. SSSA002]|uniref:5' nucleotidase, NT5C type n=1 Tax=Microbulbifer sp. SSSA002 TaxID=3243376 RepID=UPI0040397920
MIIYVDMDDVLCDYTTGIASEKEKSPEVEFPQSKPGFFKDLDPINGAIERLRSEAHIDLYILTAPSTRNPQSYTEKRIWVEDKFDYDLTKNLIMCSNKGLLKGDILIDDHTSGRGQEHFEGRLIHFDHGILPNWNAALSNVLDNT